METQKKNFYSYTVDRTLKLAHSSENILVACMPKSGSTYLSTIIACLPGMRRGGLVPAYNRREQELCEKCIELELNATRHLRQMYRRHEGGLEERPRGFVAQHHVRCSDYTQHVINDYEIKTIVLVRNLFDIVVSLRDHLVNNAVYMSMAYFTDDMKKWESKQVYRFLADMAMPWYINFFISWTYAKNVHFVSYEQLVAEPMDNVRSMLLDVGCQFSNSAVKNAVTVAGGKNTRKNVAVIGRGVSLVPEDVQERIRAHASYYPEVDFSLVGL
jgi:hypothetical protein